MKTIKRGLVCIMIMTFTMAISSPAMASLNERPSGAAMAVDIPIRVLSLGLTLVGFAVFIPTLLFTAFGEEGSVGMAWDGLVGEPAEFTFRRPLGKFDDWRQVKDGQD
ncbi:MAG: hypothetical protein HQM12_01745 [SAR324 cluster bacterium]|nr:hypothetical protein [SAR324 cluster bacterium]